MDGNCNNEITAAELERVNFNPRPIFIYNNGNGEPGSELSAEVEQTQESELDKNTGLWFENVDEFFYECELCHQFLLDFEQLKLHVAQHKSTFQNHRVESPPNHEYENENDNNDNDDNNDQREKPEDSTSCPILKTILEFRPISKSSSSSSSSLNHNHNLTTLKSSEISLNELLKTSQMPSPLNRGSFQNPAVVSPALQNPVKRHSSSSSSSNSSQFSQLSRAHFLNFNRKSQILNRIKNGLDLTARSHSLNSNSNSNVNSNVNVKYVNYSPATVNSESSPLISTPAPVPAPLPVLSQAQATKIGPETISFTSSQNNGKKLKLSPPDLKTLVSNHQNGRNQHFHVACDLCFFNNSIANQFDSMYQLYEHKRLFHKIVKPVDSLDVQWI